MKTTTAVRSIIPGLFVLFVITLFAGLNTASAATINVTTTADELNANGQCSLREAITNINDGASTYSDCAPTGAYGITDTINIPVGTYTTTTGSYNIAQNVSIVGTGAGTTTINGGGLNRVFYITGAYTVSISGVTITGGTAPDFGGAIYMAGVGTLTVSNSTITGNSAVGPGGGISSGNFIGGTVNVTNSTLSNNTAGWDGGGIHSYTTINVTNSTVTGNVSMGWTGGGIMNGGHLALTNSTITGNWARGGPGGSGIYAGTLTAINSIVANQTVGEDCVGVITTSGGYNLESATSCGFTGTGDMQNTAPLLGPLQDNGGPTFTHALLDGSPAIDSIPNGVNGCGTTITTDQRGVSRPQPSAGLCDMGAFEVEYHCVQPPSGLISWWGGDNNALDMVGTKNGTLVGGVTYAQGKVGQAFSFDGINDYISANLVSTATIDVSMDAWVNWGGPNDANSVQRIFYIGNSSSDGYGIYLDADGTLAVLKGGNSYDKTTVKLTPGVWQHIAVVRYNLTIWKVYLNATQVSIAENMYSFPDVPTGNTFIGGSTTGSEPFKGLIDEVEFFNRTLSASEIAAIYNAGSAGKCRSCAPPPSGMVSWWGGDNNALDRAGTNNGTLVNGTTYASGRVGQAFSFDGVDDSVSVGMLGNIGRNEGNSFTVSAWINLLDINAYQVVAGNYMGEGGDTGNFSTYMGINNGEIMFVLNQRQIDGVSIAVPVAKGWHHVTGTYDGTNIVLYLDGQLKGTVVRSFTGSTDNTRGWYIGNFSPETTAAHGYQSSFSGLIDEVEIFNRALSADEIAAIYNAGSAGQCVVPMIKREPSNTYYDRFVDAFTGALDSNNILVREGTVTEDADYNNAGVLVNLRGGCSLDFVPDPLKYSTINGSLKISNGGISVGNIIVK
ncbi:MAG: hypothetical protein C0402_06855 [Thermodesulfovibrio sp.]|nr:hypothetical protein [Thermodesulfovibrio sp.]